VEARDLLCSQWQTTLFQRDEELAQLRQRVADAEAALASRTNELREAEAREADLQAAVRTMAASHFPRLRAAIDGCKNSVLKPLNRHKPAA
jgi:chromosome segregation ATPase